MKPHSIALTLPLRGHLPNSARAIGATMVGGVGGLALAMGLGMAPAVPMLVGLILGLAVGSPGRPRGVENLVGHGMLAGGAAALAGTLINGGTLGIGWLVAAVAMGLVAGAHGQGWRQGLTRFGLVTLSMGAVIAGFALLTDFDDFRRWGSHYLPNLFALSGGLGAAAWVGSSFDLKLLPEGDARPPAQLVAASGDTQAPDAQAVAESDDGDGREELFGEEAERLTKARRRIESLAEKIGDLAPHETAFVEQLHETLELTLDRAHGAIDRWRMVNVSTNTMHAEVLRERLASSEARLEAVSDNETLQRMLLETVSRQSETLAEYERQEAELQTFALRLQQVQSGLELLELTVERVLTAGGSIDSTEVDAIVEAMADVHAVLQ